MNKDEACNYRDQGYIELMPPPTTNNNNKDEEDNSQDMEENNVDMDDIEDEEGLFSIFFID